MEREELAAYKAIEILESKGYKAYLVGGCVRDKLMGVAPHDFDITTDATPSETEKAFSGYRNFGFGKKHGTVTIDIDGFTVEITTFRADGNYSDRRHPDKVCFSGELRDDLKRRDFTINAIAYNPREGFIDFFGGKEDIEKGIIRCVGNADERFGEDALRILRALRFAAQKNFSVEPGTSEAIIKNRKLLEYVSAERIYSELKKTLEGAGAERILIEYYPVFLNVCGIETDGRTKECCKAMESYIRFCRIAGCTQGGIETKLSAFILAVLSYSDLESYLSDRVTGITEKTAVSASEKSLTILKNLKSDRRTFVNVSKLIMYLPYPVAATERYARQLLRKFGEEFTQKLLKLKKTVAYVNGAENESEKIAQLLGMANNSIKNGECYSLKSLAVNGEDLIRAGVKPGLPMSELLDKLLDKVIDDQSLNTRGKLLEIAGSEILNEEN